MTKKSKKRKYLILDKLQSLPYEEYKIAKSRLPLVLGISKRTFERWCYLTITETPEVPVDKIAIVAKYFNCTIEELINYRIPQYDISKLLKLTNSNLAKELKLTR